MSNTSAKTSAQQRRGFRVQFYNLSSAVLEKKRKGNKKKKNYSCQYLVGVRASATHIADNIVIIAC